MALDMTQSGDNGAKANESAGFGGDFAGAEARALQDAGTFQQAVKFAQAAPTTMIPGAPPLILPEQYIPGTEQNQQLSRETVRALEHAYGNFRENSRHIGQLIENGQYGESAKQLITGMEHPQAPDFNMQSSPVLNDWSTAFGDKELEGLQRSAPDTPDTSLEGFPGERLPPPPPMVTPVQEPQSTVTWTPIPEQTKPEAIGGGYSVPEVNWALPGLVPVTPPVDSHILKSSAYPPPVKTGDPFPTTTIPNGQVGGKPLGETETISMDADESMKRGIRAQNDALVRLADAGYQIVLQPKSTLDRNGQPYLTQDLQRQLGLAANKNPDAVIEGRVFDVYAPDSNNVRHIHGEITKKITENQSHRIVLNLQDSNVSTRELHEYLAINPINKLKEIILIDKNNAIKRFFP